MKVSRVILQDVDKHKGSFLATCSIVLDEQLKLNEIRLYKNREGKEYLVLPSKQDICKEILDMNKGNDIRTPVNCTDLKNCDYNEYFHPVDSFLYRELLEAVVSGYKSFLETGKSSYRPK